MEIKELSCREFVSELGSKAPVPGGGGASALVGAIGAALGTMVGSLTVGKKKYAEVEDEIIALMARAEKLQQELTELIDEDARGFEPLAAAYGLPSNTDEEKIRKAEIMEGALVTACQAPLAMMEKCAEAIELQAGFAELGSRLALSDAGVGAVLLGSAMKGASLNVFINTKSMKDRETAEKLDVRAEALLEKYCPMAENIFSQVKIDVSK